MYELGLYLASCLSSTLLKSVCERSRTAAHVTVLFAFRIWRTTSWSWSPLCLSWTVWRNPSTLFTSVLLYASSSSSSTLCAQVRSPDPVSHSHVTLHPIRDDSCLGIFKCTLYGFRTSFYTNVSNSGWSQWKRVYHVQWDLFILKVTSGRAQTNASENRVVNLNPVFKLLHSLDLNNDQVYLDSLFMISVP